MGKRIERLLAKKNGGNQSELARFVGVTPQAVQQWISEETSPRGKNLEKAAEFLGVTPAELRFGDQANTEPAGQPANELTPRQQALLGLFEGLTDSQKDNLIRELQEKKQQNDEMLIELLKRKAT